MVRTPVAKRIKNHIMVHHVAVPSGTTIIQYNAFATWTLQEDITVIGCRCQAQTMFEATPALTEGTAMTAMEFSRNGAWGGDGQILALHAHIQYWTEIVIAAQLGGCFGDLCREMTLMFPEGYGVDVDDGEHLYLNLMAINTILASGQFDSEAVASIYYVER